MQDFLVILYKSSCIFGWFLHFYTNFAKSLAIPTGVYIMGTVFETRSVLIMAKEIKRSYWLTAAAWIHPSSFRG